MIVYVLKFSACLAIFLVFYKLVLEKENMHQFKRYFLLAVLFIALSIPLITFTTYVEPVISNSVGFNELTEYSILPQTVEEPTNYVPIILWSIYGLGVLLFGIKFIWNLAQIVFKVKRNPRQKNTSFLYVLLQDLVVPHTFFNYIFLNKQKFETNAIPQEVFWHEEAHATQKHSLDVLFIELLQVIFWFNPLIYFTKHAVKLNHEFLADQAVLNKGIQPSTYQQILLAFSSPDSYRDVLRPLPTAVEMANAINYSSIKKRFTVMKTHTSKRNIWMRSFLLLPLVALTLYGFSGRKEVFKNLETNVFNKDTIQDIIIYINENEELFLNKIPVTIENLPEEINKLNKNLTKEQKSIFLSPTIQYEDEKSQSTIKKIQSILVNLNFSSFSTSNLNNLKKVGLPSAIPTNKYSGKTIEEAEKIYENETIDLSPSKKGDPESPWKIDVGVNEVSYEEVDNDDERLKGITPEMMDEYDAIVKTINSKPKDKMIVKLKDISRLTWIYSQMTEEQKKSALSLPEIYDNQPIDISTPKDNNQNSPWQIGVGVSEVSYDNNDLSDQQKATPEEVEWYNKLIRDVNSKPESQRIFRHKDVIKLEDIYKRMSKEQKENSEPFPNFPPPPPPPPPLPKTPKAMKGNDLPPPPPPPAPKSPLEHIKEMTKKGATFYFEDKIISSDGAIDLLKKNNELNIQTKQADSKEPKVYISKEPVTIKAQTKSSELVMVNGKKLESGMIEMTIEELKNANFTFKNSTLVSFMFKIPGVKTEIISGDRLNSSAIVKLDTLKVGSAVQLFLFKDSNNSVHPPLLIEIKE